MRRPFLVFALALLAAAALSASAFAKEGGVELSSTAGALGPGDPWTPSLTMIDEGGQLPANPKPGIRITNLETGRTVSVRRRCVPLRALVSAARRSGKVAV